MNKREEKPRAFALQIAICVFLICFSIVLLASSFRAAPANQPNENDQSKAVDQTGFYPPLPNQVPNLPQNPPSQNPPDQSVAVSAPTFYMDPTISTVDLENVTCTNINASLNYIGFQADMVFDSAVAAPTPAGAPVNAADLTASGWTVAGNVINTGPGTFKTLRVSAFTNDGITPLSGAGTLYQIKWKRVSSVTGATTALTWASVASANDFEFIDTDLNLTSANPQNNGQITIGFGPLNIVGRVRYCSNATRPPVPGVTLTLTGSASATTASDSGGNYQFLGLNPGGNYTVTPTKDALAPASPGISTVDVVGVQRHFLGITLIPPGCQQTAADVNGDNNVTTVDVVAIQRFFLGLTGGIANVGKYNFNPAFRGFSSPSDVPGGSPTPPPPDFDALVFGDVTASFVHRPAGQSQDLTEENELPATVATLTLPTIRADRSQIDFIGPVTTSMIDRRNNLVGFQGDFTFDERVIRLANEPVQKAGLTIGNWNVSGNVLPGTGPIRTLRVSAYSNDFTPLSGEGTLFELRMVRASNAEESTPLTWAAPPNQFIFIDADLRTQQPGAAISGNAAFGMFTKFKM